MFVCLFTVVDIIVFQKYSGKAAAHRFRSRQIWTYFIFTTLISTVIARIFQIEHIDVFENTFIWLISLTISSWKADGFYLKYVHFLHIKLVLDRAEWLDGFSHSSFKLTVICSSVIPLFFGA